MQPKSTCDLYALITPPSTPSTRICLEVVGKGRSVRETVAQVSINMSHNRPPNCTCKYHRHSLSWTFPAATGTKHPCFHLIHHRYYLLHSKHWTRIPFPLWRRCQGNCTILSLNWPLPLFGSAFSKTITILVSHSITIQTLGLAGTLSPPMPWSASLMTVTGDPTHCTYSHLLHIPFPFFILLLPIQPYLPRPLLYRMYSWD